MGKNIRWIIVLLLFLVYMINYLDRVALSITVPMIEKDLALNAEQFGIIFGSFFFGYAVFNFIGGLAVDKFGATLVMGLAFGWRPAFMIIFAIGIVWMIAWFYIAANSPEKHKKVSQEELKLINKMKEEEVALETIENQTAHSLGYYLKQPIILVTAFAFFCYNYILFFFLSWFPSYLVQQHHLDIKQMSLTTMIPWIVGFVGLALGGYISDKIFKLTGRLLLSRKIVLVVCLLMAAICVGLAGTVSSVVPAVLLMSVSIFFLYVTGAIYWAIIQDVVHKSRVGGASGFIHLIGSVSGIVGPIVTGYIVQSTGKFDSAFVLAGTIAALGALLVLFVIKTPRVTMKASQA
ncbi:TPA: MFS transporter [Klebsiella pneumoniae]